MWPTYAAAIVHFLFRATVFFEQPTQPCSAAPSVSSVLILISTLMILSDFKLFPDRYASLPDWFRFGAKFLINMLLVEFAMIFVWCRLESVVQKFFKCVLMDGDLNMYADMGGDALPAAVITLASMVVFVYTGEATKCFVSVKALLGTIIVNVMVFVRSITSKFREQILVTFMQRSGEMEEVAEPVCQPPPICGPTTIVCSMAPPLTCPVGCSSTAVQEIPVRDDGRCKPVVKRESRRTRSHCRKGCSPCEPSECTNYG
jgi:Domain of unknown function (DUF4818)